MGLTLYFFGLGKHAAIIVASVEVNFLADLLKYFCDAASMPKTPLPISDITTHHFFGEVEYITVFLCGGEDKKRKGPAVLPGLRLSQRLNPRASKAQSRPSPTAEAVAPTYQCGSADREGGLRAFVSPRIYPPG